jgi:hypothetical protein
VIAQLRAMPGEAWVATREAIARHWLAEIG